MSWHTVTVAVLILVTDALIVYDVIAIWRGGVESSISEIILTTSRKRPLLPFAVGVLCGHFFFPQ